MPTTDAFAYLQKTCTGQAAAPLPTCVSTTLVLAFPVPPQRAMQQVYTFLPVCCVGLPFILHAEFDLVASRGEVRSDSIWNKWLRGMAAQAFANAMQNHERLRYAQFRLT